MKTKLMALEALKLALPHINPKAIDGVRVEAEPIADCYVNTIVSATIAAIEADIAEPVEPVAWMRDGATSVLHNFVLSKPDSGPWIPLYTTPQEPADRNPYGWQVQGLRDTFKGDHAEMDAKSEAARVGGTAYAFPIYIDPTAVTESTP